MREIIKCEVCDDSRLSLVMDLGQLPLPDELVPIGDPRVVPKYPTEVLFCDNCLTAYQRWAPPNEVVFPHDYHYRAANTKDVLSGMQGLVDAVEKHGLVHGLKVLDVGCNDGSLLDAFARRGAIGYGIEPTDAAQEAAAKGHHVEQVYLDVAQAEQYVSRYGQPDLITFTNVFAHIENFHSLLGAMRVLLGPKTRLVVENHYLGSVLDRGQFDTFYHEHPRTYSCASFEHIAKQIGMKLFSVEFPARYGGNIRVMMEPGIQEYIWDDQLRVYEMDFRRRLHKLDQQVGWWKSRKQDILMRKIVEQGAPVMASAMPGRATMLFNVLGMGAYDIAAVYEVPRSKKIGHYVPGTHIPILSDADFPWHTYKGPVLNMAWHIADEIEQRWRERGFTGEFIQAIEPSDFV